MKPVVNQEHLIPPVLKTVLASPSGQNAGAFQALAVGAIAKWDVVYISSYHSNGTAIVSKADSDAASTCPDLLFVALTAADVANGTLLVHPGPVNVPFNTTGLSINAEIYVSGTAGAMTSTAGTIPRQCAVVAKANATVANGGSVTFIAAAALSGGLSPSLTVVDSSFRIVDDGDPTKKIAFQASAITTATTRTITAPDYDLSLTTPDFVGINNTSTLNQDANIDQDVTFAGASGTGIDQVLLAQSATGNIIGAHLNVGQDTNARTGGTLTGLTVTVNGLAGDTSGGQYYGVVLDAADAGGSGVFHGIYFAAGSWDYAIDSSQMATGQNVWLLPTNKAAAWSLYDGTNTYLSAVSTTGSEKVVSSVRLTTTDGVSGGTQRKVGGLISELVAAVTHTDPAGAGDAAETTIHTVSLPANMLKSGTRMLVRWAASCTTGGTAETVVLRVRIGGLSGTIIAACTSSNPATNDLYSGQIHLTSRAAPSATSQLAWNSQTFNSVAAAGDPTINQAAGTANAATNGALDLVFTVDFAAVEAVGGDVISLNQFSVELHA